jgi:hypothetical protein
VQTDREGFAVRWLRFNIASLIVFILLCGFAFAALKESSDIWEHGVFSVTLLALIATVLLAIHTNEARRAFWLGFALVGGCYLVFTLVPPMESRLVSSQGLSYVHSKLPGQPAATVSFVLTTNGGGGSTSAGNQTLTLTASGNPTTAASGSGRVWMVSNGNLFTRWVGSSENFVKIGHSVLALMLGWLGGVLSRWLWRRARRTERPAESPALEASF